MPHGGQISGIGREGSRVIGSFPSGRTNSLPDAMAFCKPAGKLLGGEMLSGLMVNAATVAGRRAGSVARLVFRRNRGMESSSSRIFLGSGVGACERTSSESRRLSRREFFRKSASFVGLIELSFGDLGLGSSRFERCRSDRESSRSTARLLRRLRASSESAFKRKRKSSAVVALWRFCIEWLDEFSLGGGGRLGSSSAGVGVGLETVEPPSTPLLTEGVLSESLHSSSSPATQGNKKKNKLVHIIKVNKYK